MVSILSSVGRDCPQQKSTDVKAVQQLLNRAGALTSLNQPLNVDGQAGPKTIAAIEEFQKTYLRLSDGKVQPGHATIAKLNEIADELQLVVATVYGESAASSPVAWKSILCVMKNRVAKREWAVYRSISDVIRHTGFDAHTQRNMPYSKAFTYMGHRSVDHVNGLLEQVVRVLRPIYRGNEADVTSNAVLYFSPKAQAALHKTDPTRYADKPKWNFTLLKEVQIAGLLSTDDFKFYAYK